MEPMSLSGQLLVAMPQMQDPRFAHTVIFMCMHNEGGAMGLVVNKLIDELTMPSLLDQLGIETSRISIETPVYFGGPVEAHHGFVLHSADYVEDCSLVVEGGVALTASIDILRAIALGTGPRHSLLALGYAGWGPGQLDRELQANGWLHVEADENILFRDGNEDKWLKALRKLGISPEMLSSEAGHA
ncbi:MAG: YqgE/AlgH family protein [Stellaceae bacterium]